MVKASEIPEIFNNHGVVILPTDTVYGIFAKATDKKAINKIFKIKKRNKKKPLQVFLPDIKSIKKYANVNFSSSVKLKKLLPGPYTVILKLNPKYKKTFTFLSAGTIGIRVIRYSLLNRIMKKVGAPVAATSANVSGKKTPVLFRNIEKKLIKLCDGYVINDNIVKGKASAVIDLTGKGIKILRGSLPDKLRKYI